VTLVDAANALGDGLPYQAPLRYHKWFTQEGVVVLTGVTCQKITDEGLVVRTKEGTSKVLKADNIVLAMPLIPDNGFCETLKKEGIQVFQAGDCREFGLMHGAIADGARIGRAV
jgi:2,4-dienoyl-CoA reductase (NADPH2)